MEQTGKSYYFIFNDDCFDRNSQRSNIARQKRPYNKTVYDMNKAVEELDRYDDFDSLKIEPIKYKKEDGEYGIQYKMEKHVDGTVIFPHQQKAALSFLKDLRGFGLLADVVGSGKTFEASVILSELAVRGKIKSMLLVVPGQVYDSWIDVLGTQFGLGKNVLFEATEHMKTVAAFQSCGITFDEQNRPSRPIIVKTEDFVNWDNNLSTLLFDVIVVDEAHHLCKEDGEYAKAMKLLSMMMATKKRANVTYCLLLSATPHSGNLAHMFRLWYFVRCKGGHPDDFDEKEDINRSAEYNREKAYYQERVCRGATTVMEFIKNVKMSEVLLNYEEEFFTFIAIRGTTREKFGKMAKGEQQMLIDNFLTENWEVREKVMRNVASAYHNGVLRSIMIRQPSGSRIGKSKTQINYLFYPASKEYKDKTITVGDINEDNCFKVNLSRLSLENDPCITAIDKYDKSHNQTMVSLAEYVRDNCGNNSEASFHSDVMCNIFKATKDDSAFEKENYEVYYESQMKWCPDNTMRCLVQPIYDKEDLFTPKFEQTKKLLRKHKDQRVLVFFDYELKKSELMHGRFEKAILADDEFKDRVIIGTGNNKEQTLAAFHEKSNAILVVTDAAFTEGVNLQKSNIIINFQVTPDPLSMDQRIGRIFRLGQTNDVIIYSLANMHKLEGFALMYFTRIGLMSSNSGDATIIAGSNNERMVAVQCDRCGKVALYSQEDFETHKKNGDLICIDGPNCKSFDRPNGTEMQEISVYDFKCDKCSTVFARSISDESGYYCVSASRMGKSIMCNSGDKGDRAFYCRKICAMANCSRFRPGECAAVEAYKRNKSIGDADLGKLCEQCPNKSRCPEKCRFKVGKEGILPCTNCQYASCRPKPHVIEFDDRWEADCPVCRMIGGNKRGRIRPVVARTFAAYLRASWDFSHDGGKAFCNNLLDEAGKVTDIKEVLDADAKE